MKPFDLKKFLSGEPAITRDGRKVIEHYYFKNARKNQVLGYVIEGDFDILFADDNGNYQTDKNESRLDLFMEEKEVDLWINVYEELSGYTFYEYETEKIAKENINADTFVSTYKGTHKLTIKE